MAADGLGQLTVGTWRRRWVTLFFEEEKKRRTILTDLVGD
jgi:hypothetical protein